MDCCVHTQDMSTYFGERKAQDELWQYLKRGLASHASAMREAVAARGITGATLLEVGSGIGSLSVELLKRGASRAVNVEASPAYLKAAQVLADQTGFRKRMDFRHADFAETAGDISAAEIVVMHRVVCCYPDMRGLVSAAAEHTGRVMALSTPRDGRLSRLYVEAQAWWLRRKGFTFRNYVHSPEAILQAAAGFGLRIVDSSFSGRWQIAVFER